MEGQTPWPTILAHFSRYWRRAVEDTREKYALNELASPVFKWVKPVKKAIAKQQRRYIALLLGILVFILLNMRLDNLNMIISKTFSLANTFMWLLAAIVTALLIIFFLWQLFICLWRGKVSSINYQTTQVDTINNTSVSFPNSTLFAKNFSNLTKGSAYEFLKIVVGVAYGTDVQQVREVIENAMQVMCTKDQFGRDIVDPRHGIYVRLGDFGDSAVNIAVKQYVLAAERIPYIDKAKEVIYNALNESGISIPFPQCDIHVVSEEMK